jgi:hypothetical protein
LCVAATGDVSAEHTNTASFGIVSVFLYWLLDKISGPFAINLTTCQTGMRAADLR